VSPSRNQNTHEDVDLLLENGWSIDMTGYKTDEGASGVRIAASRGDWWIEFSYPIHWGILEFYPDGRNTSKGEIGNREKLHQIIRSVDSELSYYVKPLPVKPGTARK
jgi:hypothetical protein